MHVPYLYRLRMIIVLAWTSTVFIFGVQYRLSVTAKSLRQRISSPVIARNERDQTEDAGYLKELWTKVENSVNENELYSEDFNVDEVLSQLRNTRILNVSMEHSRTAFKWAFILEGGQKAVFKPKL